MILAADQAAPTSSDLRAFLATKLLPYQIPTTFLFVEELPRTPSLKPNLPEVKRLFANVAEVPA